MNTVTGERDQLKSAKIAVLKLINEHKEILFGKVSDVLTREVKEAKWDEVAEQAHTLGAFPWHRSWDYLSKCLQPFVQKSYNLEIVLIIHLVII